MERYPCFDVVSGQSHLKGEVMPLKNKELSNWEVSRISLSKRSYCVPKSNLTNSQIIKASKYQLSVESSATMIQKIKTATCPISMKVMPQNCREFDHISNSLISILSEPLTQDISEIHNSDTHILNLRAFLSTKALVDSSFFDFTV